MNILREFDTILLSIPPVVVGALGVGCRFVEFSGKPVWREVGWAGARFLPYVAIVFGAALFIHRFACALIFKIANEATQKRFEVIVDISEFMDKRLTFVLTGLPLLPLAMLHGPWIFNTPFSLTNFIDKAKEFYKETSEKFESMPPSNVMEAQEAD